MHYQVIWLETEKKFIHSFEMADALELHKVLTDNPLFCDEKEQMLCEWCTVDEAILMTGVQWIELESEDTVEFW